MNNNTPSIDLNTPEGSNLLNLLRSVELDHFRTVHDTGANPCALLVWSALRKRIGLPMLNTDDLPAYDDKEARAYVMSPASKLLTNPAFDPAPVKLTVGDIIAAQKEWIEASEQGDTDQGFPEWCVYAAQGVEMRGAGQQGVTKLPARVLRAIAKEHNKGE